MRVIGYDPGSETAGLCLADRGVPKRIDIWQPASKKSPALSRLREFADDFGDYLNANRPVDMVVVEIIAMSRSHKVTRILSRYESAAIIEAKRRDIMVIEHRVAEARLVSLGRGDISKEEAYFEMKRRFPDLPWLGPKSGGMDQSDAAVMAMAGPSLAER